MLRKQISALCILSALCAAFALAAAPGRAAEVTYKIGHDMPENHPYHNFSVAFAEEVAKNTNGRIQVDVFPGAVLGTEMAMTDSLRMGTLDFLISTTGNSSSLLPRMGLMGMPFLYENAQHVLAVGADQDLLKYFQKIVNDADVDVELLAFCGSAPRHIYSTVSIKKLEDVKGLKMRTQTSPIEVECWTALGAIPTSMPISEVYTALETNLVSAAENNPTSYVVNKHNEVAPYYVRTEHTWMMHPILAAKSTMDAVSDADRKAIIDAIAVAGKAMYEAHLVMDKANLEEGIAGGVVYTDAIDREPFKKIIIPIQDRVAKELDTVYALDRVRSLAK